MGFAPGPATTMSLKLRLPSEVEFGIAGGKMGGGPVGPVPSGVESGSSRKPTEPATVEEQKPIEPEPEITAVEKPKPSKTPRPRPRPKPPQPAPDAGKRQTVDGGIDGIKSDAAVPGAPGGGAAFAGEGGLYGQGSGGLYGGMFGTGDGPAGAHLALRLDMKRIRESALVLEVGPLLEVIPGWKRVLGGSGFEPLDHFQRVFVASPNLERSRIVIAARHRRGNRAVRSAADRLARKSGKPVAWSQREGIPTAPWRSRDRTARIVSLTGTDHFLLSRPQDLPRVLSVARALARRGKPAAGTVPGGHTASLLSLEPGEAMVLNVEGARHYVRGEVKNVPLRIRIALSGAPPDRTHLVANGAYDAPGQAAKACAALEALRPALALRQEVALAGLRSAIEEAVIAQDRDQVRVEMDLTLHQTRYLLQYLRQALIRYAGRSPLAQRSSASPQ